MIEIGFKERFRITHFMWSECVKNALCTIDWHPEFACEHWSMHVSVSMRARYSKLHNPFMLNTANLITSAFSISLLQSHTYIMRKPKDTLFNISKRTVIIIFMERHELFAKIVCCDIFWHLLMFLISYKQKYRSLHHRRYTVQLTTQSRNQRIFPRSVYHKIEPKISVFFFFRLFNYRSPYTYSCFLFGFPLSFLKHYICV